MPTLTCNAQLKAVRLLRQAEVIMYDDLGAEVSLANSGKTCPSWDFFLCNVCPNLSGSERALTAGRRISVSQTQNHWKCDMCRLQ